MQIAESEVGGSQKADLCNLRARKYENLQFEIILQINLQIEELGDRRNAKSGFRKLNDREVGCRNLRAGKEEYPQNEGFVRR